MKKQDLPKLDPANYGPWLLALRSAAHALNAYEHISGDPQPPTEPTELQPHLKQKHIMQGKILSSVPADILNLLLTPSDDPTPHKLLSLITEHLDNSNSSDHKYLKQEAEQCFFEPGMTLSDYITAHYNIHTRIIAARYPDISNPITTVEFLKDGLRHNPNTAPIGLQLIALAPTDVNDFTHKFNRILAYNKPTHQAVNHIISPTPQGLRRSPYTFSRPQHRTHMNHPQTHKEIKFKPCTHHLNRGIPHPQHTDEACKERDHPNNQTKYTTPSIRRKGQYTRAHMKNTPHTFDVQQEANHPFYDDENRQEEIPHATSNILDHEDLSDACILDSVAHPSHTLITTRLTEPIVV